MSILRKFALSAIAVPVLGMTMITAQPLAFDGSANAASYDPGKSNHNNGFSGRDNGRSEPRGGRKGSDENFKRTKFRLPPCPPGFSASLSAAITHASPNCRPTGTPVRSVSSEDNCSCQTKRIGGRLVRDCYIKVRNIVHYCDANRLRPAR